MSPCASLTTYQRLLKKWQKILLLTDWEITVQYAKLPAMTFASVNRDPAARAATIKINRSAPKRSAYCNPEAIIVHELIHVLDPDELLPELERQYRRKFDEYSNHFADRLMRIFIVRQRELEKKRRKPK